MQDTWQNRILNLSQVYSVYRKFTIPSLTLGLFIMEQYLRLMKKPGTSPLIWMSKACGECVPSFFQRFWFSAFHIAMVFFYNCLLKAGVVFLNWIYFACVEIVHYQIQMKQQKSGAILNMSSVASSIHGK